MPRTPKDPSVRARRNKTGSEAVTAPAQAVRGPDLPELPDGAQWHGDVVRWWAAVRDHPVSALWTALDWEQALDLAQLRENWARTRSSKAYQLVRVASVGLGLDRADQRRNGWKIPVAAAPPAPVERPDPAPAPEKSASSTPKRPVRDPRRVLRSVPGGRASA